MRTTPFAKKPGLSVPVAVVDERLDRERARRLIDRRADVGDLALELPVRNASTSNSTACPGLMRLACFS